MKLPPLFSLEIVILESTVFDYNTQLSRFEEVTTNAIDYCIRSLQNISQIHVHVMEKLKWNTTPSIAAVQLKETLVQELRSRVQVPSRPCNFSIF